MNINPERFQISITKEIDSIKDRVRNLIGDANWGEEGRYKEAVLKNVLTKFLPPNLSIGTGFIIQGDDFPFRNNTVSKQLDIIIYDNSYPVLFHEGDFIITTENNVRGIVEVKSDIVNSRKAKNGLQMVLNKFNSLSEFLKISDKKNNNVFKGIFSFNYDGDIDSNLIDDSLIRADGIVNHICLGKDFFIKYWEKEFPAHGYRNNSKNYYSLYNLNNLSFSYFISNLVQICTNKEMEDRQWFLYPIKGTKESKQIRNISLK